MKLNFNHRGVKLFFITFAVAGRAKVLSRLVDEKSRPELTGLDIRRNQAAAHGFRQNCLLMNEIAAALCNRQ